MLKLADVSLLNACNFSCDYCKSGASPVRQNNPNAWDVNGPILDYYPLINYIKNNLSNFIIQITGGEPLIMSGVEYLLNELVKENQVIVNTNGSLLKQKFSRINENVFFRISLHPDQRTLTEFAIQLKDIPKDRFIINYVLHPRHIRSGKCFEYIDWLEYSNYNYEVTPFEGSYNKESFRLVSEIYNHIKTPAVLMGEQEIVVIKPNGLVFPCHGVLNDEKSIGDIYTGRFDISGVCNHRCRTPDDKSMCPSYDPVIRILNIIKNK